MSAGPPHGARRARVVGVERYSAIWRLSSLGLHAGRSGHVSRSHRQPSVGAEFWEIRKLRIPLMQRSASPIDKQMFLPTATDARDPSEGRATDASEHVSPRCGSRPSCVLRWPMRSSAASRSEGVASELAFEVVARSVTVAVSGDAESLTAPALAGVLRVLLDDRPQLILSDHSSHVGHHSSERMGFIDHLRPDLGASEHG